MEAQQSLIALVIERERDDERESFEWDREKYVRITQQSTLNLGY